MYPIAIWSYDQLIRRLDNLMEHDFHRETILACNQTILQLFKRLIKVQLSKTSKIPSNGKRGGKLIDIISLEERDQLLLSIQYPIDFKKIWDSYARFYRLQSTQELFDQCFQPDSWHCYSKKRRIVTNLSIELPYGVHYAADKIRVNGYQNPGKNDLENLSVYGFHLVKHLLHPEKGVFSLLGLDITEKTPPLKLKHSNLDAYYS